MMFRIPTVPALAYHSEYDGIIINDNIYKYGAGTLERAYMQTVLGVSEDTACYYEEALNELYATDTYEEYGEYYILLSRHSSDSLYEADELYYVQINCDSQVYMMFSVGNEWFNVNTGLYEHICPANHSDSGEFESGVCCGSCYIFSDGEMSGRYYNKGVQISDSGKNSAFNDETTSSCTVRMYSSNLNEPNYYMSFDYYYKLVSTNIPLYNMYDCGEHLTSSVYGEHFCKYGTDVDGDGLIKACDGRYYEDSVSRWSCGTYAASNVYEQESIDDFFAGKTSMNVRTTYHDGEVSETGVTYDASQIALSNFYMMYHDASNFENCYIEFKYDITDYMRENIEQCVIDISSLYEHSAEVLWGADGLDNSEVLSYQTVSLSECSSGFKLYLKDIASVKEVIDRASGIGFMEDIMENMIIGDVTSVDVSSYPIVGDIASTVDGVIEVTYSDLYLELIPRINQSYGSVIRPHVDLLTGEFDYYESVPDDNGNYTDSEKVESEEHYYIDVSQDDFGNDEYTYYIIDENSGLSTQIDGNVSVTIDFAEPLTLQFANSFAGGIAGGSSSSSSSSSGGADIDLTIEDDDYSDEQLREDLADGFGLLDDSETDTKGDGYVNLVADLIDGSDNDLGKILAFGVSSVVGAAIIRAWLRR